MAYTKTPTIDTHSVTRIPSSGTSFLVTDASSTNNAYQVSLAYLDCYPKQEKQWDQNPKTRISKREGWESIAVTSGTITTGLGDYKSIVQGVGSYNTTCWFNIGTNIYSLSPFNGTPVLAVEQTGVSNSASSCTGTLAVDNSNDHQVCFLDGTSHLFTFKMDGTSNTTTDLSAIGVTGSGNLIFLNGYLFAVGPAGKIYNSSPGGDILTWVNTDYIVPEIYPDFVYWIEKHHNHLVAFSEYSVEFFYDAAIEVGSPLARQESYAVNVGLASFNETMRTCRIGDDIYFLGRNQSDQINLYRIRNFKVEVIDQPYFNAMMNWVYSSGSYQQMAGVQNLVINNQPMVAVCSQANYEAIYSPDDDSWWMLRTNGDTAKNLTSVNTDFPGYVQRLGTFVSEGLGYRPPTTVTYNSTTGVVAVYRPAKASIPSVQADIYTEVIDMGNNHWKHLSRIDAIGDYNNNTLTLYYNKTPNYAQTYTACSPSRVPSTQGYETNVSWYNLGAYRRFSLRLKMVGTGGAFHEGFEIESNMGAA